MLQWKPEVLPDLPPFSLKRQPPPSLCPMYFSLRLQKTLNLSDMLPFFGTSILLYVIITCILRSEEHSELVLGPHTWQWTQGFLIQVYSQSCSTTLLAMENSTPWSSWWESSKCNIQISVSKAPPCVHMKNNSSEKKAHWSNCLLRTTGIKFQVSKTR